MISNEPDTKQRFFGMEEIRVIDGDTITARLGLAFGESFTPRIRLADWYAPELEGPTRHQGQAAKGLLESWINQRKPFLFAPKHTRDLHGRVVAHLWWQGKIITAQEVIAPFALTPQEHARQKDFGARMERAPRYRPFELATDAELISTIEAVLEADSPFYWAAVREAEERPGLKSFLADPALPRPGGAESPPSSLT